MTERAKKAALEQLSQTVAMIDKGTASRDKQIVKAVRAGAGATEVATVAHITRGRVYQILRDAENRGEQ